MKIVRFLGGLGNQMFQYTLYKALKKRFPKVKADLYWFDGYNRHYGYELEKIFGIRISKASEFESVLYDIHNRRWIFRKLRRLLNLKKAYQEETDLFSFDPNILTDKNSAYYWGYWQNLNYFQDIEKEIRADFVFTTPSDSRNLQILERIRNSNSISIHVRRGDYLTDPLLGGLCELDYYENGVSHMQAHIKSPKYFVFSNDIPWCKNNLNISDCEFISWNDGEQSHIDMQLMAECKHNIIANSSFSWWAAWLNPNPKKIVIAPTKWVNDPTINTSGLIPNTWLSI